MPDDASTDPPKIGILTVSDRASRGDYEDRGGPAVRDYLDGKLEEGTWTAVTEMVHDDAEKIAFVLRRLADDEGCCLVLTTGGTGIAPRDVTPEATDEVADKRLPGFGEAMRAASLRKVPTAILSRQAAVVRGACLIVNLPGSPKAVRECLDAVWPAVPHAIHQAGGPGLALRDEASATDPELHS